MASAVHEDILSLKREEAPDAVRWTIDMGSKEAPVDLEALLETLEELEEVDGTARLTRLKFDAFSPSDDRRGLYRCGACLEVPTE